MDDSIENEVNAILATLPKHHIEALKEIFGEGEAPTPSHNRKVLPKDLVCEAEIVIICTLCGTERRHKVRSSSTKSSRLDTPTCNQCASILVTLEKEKLVEIAIKAADGMFAAVKEAKNAPIFCRYEGCERASNAEKNDS